MFLRKNIQRNSSLLGLCIWHPKPTELFNVLWNITKKLDNKIFSEIKSPPRCFSNSEKIGQLPLACHSPKSRLVRDLYFKPNATSFLRVFEVKLSAGRAWTGSYICQLHSESMYEMPYGCQPKNMGKPPNHPCFLGFSIIFTIHFGGKLPIFGSTPIALSNLDLHNKMRMEKSEAKISSQMAVRLMVIFIPWDPNPLKSHQKSKNSKSNHPKSVHIQYPAKLKHISWEPKGTPPVPPPPKK